MRITKCLCTLGFFVFVLFSSTSQAQSDNQTDTLSPVLDPDALPFTITIETAPFNLPAGIHSGAVAVHDGKWLFLAGRTNGLHGFGPDPFPPSLQNKTAYVVDYATQTVYSRALDHATSGLTQTQIDNLSVTSPQFFQNQKTLYICGGYGVNTGTSNFETKPTLTAIDVPKFIAWVIDPTKAPSAASSTRQTTNSWLQVTGGYMSCLDNHLSSLLIFGQNFTGVYTDSSNGAYTQQVRRFQIIDNGKDLYVQTRKSEGTNPSYRRRDLNVLPFIDGKKQAFAALSGVFTLDTGIWTVPVEIAADGSSFMADPDASDTFKQAMNNYVSATVTLHSPSTKDNYFLLLGGITYGYFDSGTFQTDNEIPFTNQITTVKRDSAGNYTQYLMAEEYPVILSTGSNPGNTLLFGAGAFFVNAADMPQYRNQVINFDKLHSPVVLGYIVGGIMSTLPNTNDRTDSTASPYIFTVTLNPR